MLSDLVELWPPAKHPRQGYLRRSCLSFEKQKEYSEPLTGLDENTWWSSVHLLTAEDETAVFRISLLEYNASTGRDIVITTWLHNSGKTVPMVWPLPGDMAREKGMRLSIVYISGKAPLIHASLTIGFHTLRPLAVRQCIFIDCLNKPVMIWNTSFQENSHYTIVPEMSRIIRNSWKDRIMCVSSWNQPLAL